MNAFLMGLGALGTAASAPAWAVPALVTGAALGTAYTGRQAIQKGRELAADEDTQNWIFDNITSKLPGVTTSAPEVAIPQQNGRRPSSTQPQANRTQTSAPVSPAPSASVTAPAPEQALPPSEVDIGLQRLQQQWKAEQAKQNAQFLQQQQQIKAEIAANELKAQQQARQFSQEDTAAKFSRLSQMGQQRDFQALSMAPMVEVSGAQMSLALISPQDAADALHFNGRDVYQQASNYLNGKAQALGISLTKTGPELKNFIAQANGQLRTALGIDGLQSNSPAVVQAKLNDILYNPLGMTLINGALHAFRGGVVGGSGSDVQNARRNNGTLSPNDLNRRPAQPALPGGQGLSRPKPNPAPTGLGPNDTPASVKPTVPGILSIPPITGEQGVISHTFQMVLEGDKVANSPGLEKSVNEEVEALHGLAKEMGLEDTAVQVDINESEAGKHLVNIKIEAKNLPADLADELIAAIQRLTGEQVKLQETKGIELDQIKDFYKKDSKGMRDILNGIRSQEAKNTIPENLHKKVKEMMETLNKEGINGFNKKYKAKYIETHGYYEVKLNDQYRLTYRPTSDGKASDVRGWDSHGPLGNAQDY